MNKDTDTDTLGENTVTLRSMVIWLEEGSYSWMASLKSEIFDMVVVTTKVVVVVVVVFVVMVVVVIVVLSRLNANKT